MRNAARVLSLLDMPIGVPDTRHYYDPTSAGLSIGGSLLGGAIGGGAAKSAAKTQAKAAKYAADVQRDMFDTLNAQQAPYRDAGSVALRDLLTGIGHRNTGGAATFNGAEYLAQNPDVASDKYFSAHPYEHYVQYGTSEGRQPFYGSGPATAADGSEGGISDGQFLHQFNAQDLNDTLAPNYAFMRDQGLGAVKNAANLQSGLVSGNTAKGVNDYAMNYAGNAYQNAFQNYTANQTNIFNRLAAIAGYGQTANQATAQAGVPLAQGIGNAAIAAGQATGSGQIGQANALAGGLSNATGWYQLGQIMKGGGGGTPAPSFDPYQVS